MRRQPLDQQQVKILRRTKPQPAARNRLRPVTAAARTHVGRPRRLLSRAAKGHCGRTPPARHRHPVHDGDLVGGEAHEAARLVERL